MNNLKVDTQGPARRAAGVDEGQPLPHPAVLPRLALGPGEERGRAGAGLAGDRRQVESTPSSGPPRVLRRSLLRSLRVRRHAARRQHPRPRGDLRADRCGYVLIYRVSRVLSLAHGELMMLAAYLLPLRHRVAVLGPSARGARRVRSSSRSRWARMVYVLLMRKMTGEQVLAAVLATIALGILLRGVMVLVWSAQQQYPLQALGWTNATLSIWPAAHASRASGRRWSRLHRAGVRRPVRVPALFALGHPHARGRPESAARRAARHRAARHLRPRLGARHFHRRHGRHADRDATPALDQTMVVIGLKAFPAALVGGLDSLARRADRRARDRRRPRCC